VKKYKQFIIGVLIGAMLFSSIGVCADEVLKVIANPYPVFVNGQEIQVEAYNINGFTFLKLADVGKVLNSTVSFNETEKRIEITENKKERTDDDYLVESSSVEKTTKDGLDGIIYNDIFYASLFDLEEKYQMNKGTGYEIGFDGKNYIVTNVKTNKSVSLYYMDHASIIRTKEDRLWYLNYEMLKGILTEIPPKLLEKSLMERHLEDNLNYLTFGDTEKYVTPADIISDIAYTYREARVPRINYLIDKESETISFGSLKPKNTNQGMTREENEEYRNDPENYEMYLTDVKYIYVPNNLYVVPYDDYINDIKPRLLKALGID